MVFRGLLRHRRLLLAVVISCVVRWQKPGAIYLLIGGLLYLVGTILVTIVFNVPLNDGLAAVDPTSARRSTNLDELCEKLDRLESCANGRGAGGSGFIYSRALSRELAVRIRRIPNVVTGDVDNIIG